MPAGQGKDAERFAAAAESGTPLGAAGDAELERDLEIVAMLRSRGAAFAPDPEAKARAKQRLMAVLAAEQSGQQTAQQTAQHAGPPLRGVAPATAAEQTAPLGRLIEPASPTAREVVDPNAATTRMAPVTAQQQSAAGAGTDADTDPTVEPTPLRGGRAGRRARHSIANRPAGRARSTGRPGAGALRRRVALVGSAAMVMMLAIAGGGVFASRDALPGDNLYAVKRVAESAGLAFTFDDASKARRHLEIAATRLSEVERLTALQTQAAPAPEVFTTAMDEFDAATDEGSRLLLAAAESDGGGTAASDLHAWASEQSARLTELRPALPAEADADSSIKLLEQLLGRTEAAGADGSCDGDDCDSRRASETVAPESDEADVTGGATTTPDEDGSTATSETDEPSRTPTRTPDGQDPPGLSDLLPEGNRGGEDDSTTGASEGEDGTSAPDAESGDERSDDNLEVPLPLLPPITLPPLLPGMPGITIG